MSLLKHLLLLVDHHLLLLGSLAWMSPLDYLSPGASLAWMVLLLLLLLQLVTLELEPLEVL